MELLEAQTLLEVSGLLTSVRWLCGGYAEEATSLVPAASQLLRPNVFNAEALIMSFSLSRDDLDQLRIPSLCPLFNAASAPMACPAEGMWLVVQQEGSLCARRLCNVQPSPEPDATLVCLERGSVVKMSAVLQAPFFDQPDDLRERIVAELQSAFSSGAADPVTVAQVRPEGVDASRLPAQFAGPTPHAHAPMTA